MEAVWGDVRHSFRMLRRNLTFTSAVLLTLAVGIGANTAIFSVVNSVLLKPLNYPNSDRLVALRQLAPGAAGLATVSDGLKLSASMYVTYAEQNRTFQSLGVWTQGTANVTGLAEPEQVRIIGVSDGLLQALDISPLKGRWLTQADQLPSAPKALILSYAYWQRRFGGDPAAIGRTIRVDSESGQIVGIMPPSFRVEDADFDVMAPLAFDRAKLILAGFGYNGIGRLKPGVSIAQANEDLTRMLQIWMDTWTNGPGSDPHFYDAWRITPSILPLKQEVIGDIGNVLWVVMATLGMVLLIACANVTNLLLVKGDGRQQELAVRAAVGAGRGQIVRGLMTESLILGLMGGALGLILADVGLQALVALGPASLPRLQEIRLDGATLAFSAALAVISSLLCGLIPAFKYAGPKIAAAMGSVGRTVTMGRERHRARNVLVIAQVAMASVLLICAGLMIRTFQSLRTVEPGFTDARHLQTLRVSIPDLLVPQTERVVQLQKQIADNLAALPGVSGAAFATQMPMEGYGSDWDLIQVQDKNIKAEHAPLRFFKAISPDFFRTAGTRLIAGRNMDWNEIYSKKPVVLMSENLARELWGSADSALGKRIRRYDNEPWNEVIGVVENVRENGVDAKAPAMVYWPPMTIHAGRTVTFIVRSDQAGGEALVRAIQRAVWSANPNLPVASVRTMQEVYDHSLARTSFTLVILGVAGAMALMLGIIGIYGVISYAVSQRRREMGIRLALGAQPAEVKRMFVRLGMVLAGVGVAIGLVVASGLTQLMSGLLFGISPFDPLTYAGVVGVLALAALLAVYVPARRAAGVDPAEVLRME